jgi:hypothetical protein
MKPTVSGDNAAARVAQRNVPTVGSRGVNNSCSNYGGTTAVVAALVVFAVVMAATSPSSVSTRVLSVFQESEDSSVSKMVPAAASLFSEKDGESFSTHPVNVHDHDANTTMCGTDWCDRRRPLVGLLYDGKTDKSDTKPPLTRELLQKIHSNAPITIDGHRYPSESISDLPAPTDLEETALPYVRCVRKNILLGYAVGYGPNVLGPYITAFERYHGPCDEGTLFVDNAHSDVEIDAVKGMFRLVNFRDHMSRPGSYKHDVQRVMVLENWASQNWRKYNYVIQADTRDLNIFNNVFERLHKNHITDLFNVAEFWRFATSDINRNRWVGGYSPAPGVKDFIADLQLNDELLPVICSGLYGGKSLAMYDYLGAFVKGIENANHGVRHVHGIDQGIHIYLQMIGLPLSGFPHKIQLLDYVHGPNRHWYPEPMPIIRDSLGRHLNCDKEPYAIIHQLDRYDWAFRDANSDNDYINGQNKHRAACPPTGALFVRTEPHPSKPVAPETAAVFGAVRRTASWLTTDHASPGPIPGRLEQRAWDVDATDSATVSTTERSSQRYNTVCTTHNAFLLFAHIYDPAPLQTIIASFQRYHTVCDTVVLFVPKMAEGYEALAHSDATNVIVEGFTPPKSVVVPSTPKAAAGAPDVSTPPPTAELRETDRLNARRAAPVPPSLAKHGRRLALGVIARWLKKHGGAYKYVTVVEDALRVRFGVFSNVFEPMYKHSFEGVWLGPALPGSATATDAERAAMVAEVAATAAQPAVATCLTGSAVLHASRFLPALSGSMHMWSVASGFYGGCTDAVFDYLQATAVAMDRVDKHGAEHGLEGCTSDPSVLEVLRSHVLPFALVSDREGFGHDVVILDDVQGPHRNVFGRSSNLLGVSDRFGRLPRCDAKRTPAAIVYGFSDDGGGRASFDAFLRQYRRRGEEARKTGFEATFAVQAEHQRPCYQ